MDAERARADLAAIKELVERSSTRIDAHAFHLVHWGAIVLVWYPLGNLLELNGHISWLIPLGAGAVLLGFALSFGREIRLARRPRLPGENTWLTRQIRTVTFGNVAAGMALSIAGPASGILDGPNVPLLWGVVYANLAFTLGVLLRSELRLAGIAIFAGTLVAMTVPLYQGFVLGPVMGFGLILPGMRAERRVRELARAEPLVI